MSFEYKKSLGQNFLKDNNIINKIVESINPNNDDLIVEIGPGSGALTKELVKKNCKIICFEVDERLKEPLSRIESKHLDVIFEDFLKVNLKDYIKDNYNHIYFVGNLPYYITTPLLLRFTESDMNVKSITIMVQEEVARRLVAKSGTEDYSSITLAVESWGDAKITRELSRNMFFPSPTVDSAVVTIFRNEDKIKGYDRKKINRLVRASFAMRRKTLANNLASAYSISKEESIQRIEMAGFDKNIRGERLSLNDFLKLSEQF